MTTTTPLRPVLFTPSRRSSRLLVAAGAGYLASWIAGLSVFAASVDVRSGGAAVVADYHGHAGAAVAQTVLTEGLPAIALAVVITGWWRSAATHGQGGLGRRIGAFGLTAAATSLVQCVLGVVLAAALVPGAHTGAAGTVFELSNRLDGVKMLLLAGAAVTAAVLGARLAQPKWLRCSAIAAAVTLTVSGVGYLLLVTAAADAAWLSLPLLLIWVAGSAGVLARR